MVEEASVLVVAHEQDRTSPKGRAGGHGSVNLHEKLLAITDAGWRVVVRTAAEVRGIAISRLNKNHLRPLTRRRVGHVFLEILERAEVIVKQDVGNPIEHHGEKRNPLMVNPPGHAAGI